MLRSLRLAAALLAALAVPALAQAPSATAPTTPGRAAGVPAYPGRSAVTGTPSATSAAPAPTTSTPAARPATPSASTPRAAVATGGKIDINAATEQQLDALPGVGPVLAQHIVAGRPWDGLNDLVKKKALPQGVFERNKDRFALANINTSTAADMAKTLPGIGEVRSRAIVGGRPYASPDDLVGKKVLTQNQYNKIKDLIAF